LVSNQTRQIESVDEFNEKLNGLIDEDLKHIDETWDPTMDCPYKHFLIAIEEVAQTVALPDGKKKRPPWLKKSEESIIQAIRSRGKAHQVHRESQTKYSHQTLHLSQRALSAAKAMARAIWL
jgi:hypothetical protein